LCQATDTRPLRKVSIAVTLVGLVLALVSWPGASWLVPMIYGRGYAGAIPAFRILMLAFPLMSLNYALTHQLIGWHGQRSYAMVCALALLLNLGLNRWLVPAYGIEGAAWATLGTEVLVTAGCAWGLRVHMCALSSKPERILLADERATASLR
jgi:O-antigen/teichoic acid export membrane protein